ncbi:tandem-95 repeat protein [Afipia massiliensis]|nr:Ig-like domain-containing protein [Afipia massiliensis]
MLGSDDTGFAEIPSFLKSRGDTFPAWTSQPTDDVSSSASIAIVDAQLLFHADFKRTGDDLTLIGGDGSVHVVMGYFKTSAPATIQSPSGAALTGDVIAALAGPRAAGQHASATTQEASAQAIGQVAKLEGHATVIRNGVAIVLNVGDVVLKGDVVQTDSSGTIGILFRDGSVFQITPDSRLVLTDFAYDANGSANIEEFNLVQGSFSFVSGAIAKLGNMRIGTPAATMKIDGTAGGGDVGSNNGEVTLYIFRQGDGEHRASVLDQNGNVIATLTSEGGKLILTPTGPSQFDSQLQGKTPADLAAELSALEALLKFKSIAGSGMLADAQPQSTTRHGSSSPFGDPTTPLLTPSDTASPPVVVPVTIVIPPASDSTGNTTTGNPAVTTVAGVSAVDHKTYVSADSYTLNEDGILAVLPSGVLANDSTRDGSSLTAIVDVGPQHGSLTFNPDGSFLYTPAADFSGTDTFTYHATNGTTISDPVIVTLNVNLVNDAPVVIIGTSPVTAQEQTTVFVAPSLTLADIDSTTLTKTTVQITGNYHAVEDVLSFTDTTKIHGVFDVTSGTLTLTAIAGQSPTLADFQTALQSVTYTDTSDAPSTSPRTITLTVQDPDGTAHFGQNSASAIVTLNVMAVNDAPVITGVTVPPDQTEALNASAQDIGSITGTLTAHDLDVGDTLTASVAGAAVIKLNGSTVLPPGVNLSGLGLAGNIHIDGATSDGGSKDLTWTYDPGAATLDFLKENDVLTITYTVHVSDGAVDSNTQTLTVTINGVNDAAVITSAVVNLNETDAMQTASGTLAITDVDSPATFVAQTDVAGSGGYGHFTVGVDGAWSYAMDSAHNEFKAGVTYTDVLTVTSADGTTSSITVNVAGTDDIAVIAAATVNLNEGDAVLTTGGTIAIVDPDNSPTFVAQTNVAGSGGYGHFTLGADGVWSYATDSVHNEFVAGITYTDTLNVAGTDGTTSTITVNIAGTNDAPKLLGDLTASVTRNQAYTLTTNDLNASDPDDATSNFLVSNLQHGTIKVNGTVATTFTQADVAAGRVTFAQDGSANTSASFSVTVEDGNEDLSTPVASTFHFNVTLPPEPQTIAPSSVAAGTEDQTTGVAIVLSGTDPTGTVSSYNITSISHGQLYKDAGLSQLITGNVAASGNAANNFATTVYFKPAANFDGSASFQFAAVNNFGSDDTTPATVEIDIAPVVDTATFAFGRGNVSLIVNGGFDTGMSGWSLGASNLNYVFFDTTMGQYQKQAGPVTNVYHLPGAPTGPYALAYPETTTYDAILQQSFKIPYGIESISISYDMFILNRNSTHDNVDGSLHRTPYSQFGRVDLLNGVSDHYDVSSNAVLDNLFIGTTADLLGGNVSGGFRHFGADQWHHYDFATDTGSLISFTSDQTYTLRFGVVNGYPIPLDMGVDNVVVTAKIGAVGFENDGDIVIGRLSTGDTDGSEHVTKLVLSGFVAGTVFKLNGVQVGALVLGGPDIGKWVITDQASLDALATTDLKASLPADYVGSFNVTSVATITDSAIYSDGTVHTASQTFTDTLKVEILPPNHAPTSADARIAISEDVPRTFTANDFPFSDVNSDVLQAIKIVSVPQAGGSLALNGVAVAAGQTVSLADINAGKLVFTPADNMSGSSISSFTFQVQDDGGSGGYDSTHVDTDLSLTHTITLDVNPVADIPIFLPPSAGARAGEEDTTINLGTLDISTSDPSETIKVAISGFPAGTVFKIDGVQVGALDSTPGSPTFGQWIITSASEIASLHDHALQLVPPADVNGSYSLSIAATTMDSAVVNGVTVTNTSAPVTQTLSVAINAVNDAPVAHDDLVTVNEDTVLTLTSATLRANDTDVDSSASSLLVSAVSGAVGGAVALNGTSAVFTPTAGFSGIAGFDYVISDGAGGTSSAHVTIDVKPIADHPVFTFNGTGAEDAGIVVGKLSTGDTDGSEQITKLVLSGFEPGTVFMINGTQAGALTVGGADNGKWVITDAAQIASLASNNLILQAPQNFNGSFVITAVTSVTDTATLTTGATSNSVTFTDTVQIVIDPVNDAPVVAQALVNQATGQGAPFSYQFNSNTFSDGDGDALAYSATLANGDPLPGWLSFNIATRTFSGSPPNAETLQVKVVANDGIASIASTFNIVVAVNHLPTVAPVTFSFSSGDESVLTLAGSDQDSGDSLSYKLTHIPNDVQVYLDEQHLHPVVENQVFTTDTLYIVSASADFPGDFTYVAIDSYLTESAPATASARAPETATFTGTSGNDVANASVGTLTGFTGGSVGQLRDIAGDVFLPGDGVDTVIGGRGDDTIKITSSTNVGAGDVFQGGSGTNTIDVGETTAVDLRGASISNFTNLTGGDADNTVSMTFDQFLQLGAIDLGDGTNKIDLYLPDFGSDPDAVPATQYDISNLPFPTLTGVGTVNLHPTGSGSKYLVLSQAQFAALSLIDLGAGNHDTLEIHTGRNFSMPESVVLNAEKVTIVGQGIVLGQGSIGATITGSSHSETIRGGDGDDILIGSGGNDFIDGGGRIDTYKFFGTSGGTTTVTDTGSIGSADQFDTLVLGNSSSIPSSTSPYMTFDVTRDGSTLTFTFGNETIIDQGGIDYIASYLPTYNFFNTNGYSIATGLSGTNSLIVGTDGNDIISGSGAFFGGDGNDTLTLVNSTSADFLIGGRGDDTLNGTDSYGVTYVFQPGDGNDTINDTSNYEHFIVLDTAGAAFTSLSFYDDNPASITGNLVIKYGSGGSSDQITINNQFTNNGIAGGDTIDFNGASFAGYNLGFGFYDLSHDDNVTLSRYAMSATKNTVLVAEKDQPSILRGDYFDGAKLMFGGDQNDQLYGGTKSDLMVGGGGSDHFVFSLASSSTASATDIIADFQDGVDSIDFSLLPNITSFSNLSFVYDAARNMTVVTDSFTGIVVNLYGSHTLTANDFVFENISAHFVGTSGNDTAVATPRALVGFTGGTAGQVGDIAGDLYTPGDGDDIIHAGPGADTLQLLDGSNISAGDVFDGGTGESNIYDIISIETGYVDLRPATIVNFEFLFGDNSSNTVLMSYDQYRTLAVFNLGGGTNEVNVYLPSSINSADLATAPTQFDMTSFNYVSANYAQSIRLMTTGSGNQSLKMTGTEVAQFASIDLGDGAQDALTIVTSSDFTITPGQILNVEYLTIIDGSGSDTIVGSSGTESIYGNNGDDVIMGGGGNDYLDGGTGNNTFKFTANDGHDTVAYTDGGTRTILLSGSPSYAPYDAFNITHLGADGLQLTYGNTVIDLLNYTDNDHVNIGFTFDNPIPFIYGTASFGWNWSFHHGVDGTDSKQILVGTDGVDHINAVGFGNLMFGGDGNDVITGGNALANVDPYALGGSDIYVGGKGDDMLISYGVGDPNAGPFSNIYATETYVFNVGDGQDSIDDRGGGNPQSSLYADRIIIDTKGAALTSFSASHDPSAASGGNDLVINYSSTDSITVLNQFDGQGHNIETINFNGGSYAGFDFGNTDYSLNKAGVPVINVPNGGSVIVGDLNIANDITYRSYTGAILIGGNENDRLDFDAGGGLMIGGGGADTFVFARSQVGVPAVIADFQDGQDKIDMKGLALDFSSLAITQTADATLVHADVFGGTIDFKLHGLHTLTFGDFILA